MTGLFIAITFIIIITLLVFRVPTAFAFGGGTLIMLSLFDMQTGWVMPSTFQLYCSFPLLAIPLFVLLGMLFEYSKLVRRLVDLLTY